MVRVSWEQQQLANLMEKGLTYTPRDASDKVTENYRFWFHNLAEDELLKEAKGYHCDALGIALIGKFGSPDEVWKRIKSSHMFSSPELFIRSNLFISEQLIRNVMDLHDENTSVRDVIRILRTRDLYND